VFARGDVPRIPTMWGSNWGESLLFLNLGLEDSPLDRGLTSQEVESLLFICSMAYVNQEAAIQVNHVLFSIFKTSKSQKI